MRVWTIYLIGPSYMVSSTFIVTSRAKRGLEGFMYILMCRKEHMESLFINFNQNQNSYRKLEKIS